MKVMIIGAGVTGIAAAYRLKQLGLDAVIYEKRGRALRTRSVFYIRL